MEFPSPKTQGSKAQMFTVNDEPAAGAKRTSLANTVIPIPLILSALAIIGAGAAATITVAKRPLGMGIEAYDFSTPESALRSPFAMAVNHDAIASYQYMLLPLKPEIDQKLATCEVHRTVDWKSKKVLFISYEVDGVKKYKSPTFAKDAETGLWVEKGEAAPMFEGIRTMIGEANGEVIQRDPIVEMALKWRKQGVLD